jgi:hypothetical protein
MNIINFTIKQGDEVIGSVAIREQAVNAAVTRAAATASPVSVIAHMDNGTDREVIFNPDGTNERIWAIDRGQPMQPVAGRIYTNRGGGAYRCIKSEEYGTPVFQNTKSGWTFQAKGVIQYVDGTIEWDHSINGHYEEVTA